MNPAITDSATRSECADSQPKSPGVVGPADSLIAGSTRWVLVALGLAVTLSVAVPPWSFSIDGRTVPMGYSPIWRPASETRTYPVPVATPAGEILPGKTRQHTETTTANRIDATRLAFELIGIVALGVIAVMLTLRRPTG